MINNEVRVNPNYSEESNINRPSDGNLIQGEKDLLRSVFYYDLNVVQIGEDHEARIAARRNKSKFWVVNYDKASNENAAPMSETRSVKIPFWSMKKFEENLAKNESFSDLDCEVNVLASEKVIVENVNDFGIGAMFDREEKLAEDYSRVMRNKSRDDAKISAEVCSEDTVKYENLKVKSELNGYTIKSECYDEKPIKYENSESESNGYSMNSKYNGIKLATYTNFSVKSEPEVTSTKSEYVDHKDITLKKSESDEDTSKYDDKFIAHKNSIKKSESDDAITNSEYKDQFIPYNHLIVKSEENTISKMKVEELICPEDLDYQLPREPVQSNSNFSCVGPSDNRIILPSKQNKFDTTESRPVQTGCKRKHPDNDNEDNELEMLVRNLDVETMHERKNSKHDDGQVKKKIPPSFLGKDGVKRNNPDNNNSEEETNVKKVCISGTFVSPKSVQATNLQMNTNTSQPRFNYISMDSTNDQEIPTVVDPSQLNDYAEADNVLLYNEDRHAYDPVESETVNSNQSLLDEVANLRLMETSESSIFGLDDELPTRNAEAGNDVVLEPVNYVNVNDNPDPEPEVINSTSQDPLATQPNEARCDSDISVDSFTGYEADDEARTSERRIAMQRLLEIRLSRRPPRRGAVRRRVFSFGAEREHVFHLVGHLNDIPENGDEDENGDLPSRDTEQTDQLNQNDEIDNASNSDQNTVHTIVPTSIVTNAIDGTCFSSDFESTIIQDEIDETCKSNVEDASDVTCIYDSGNNDNLESTIIHDNNECIVTEKSTEGDVTQLNIIKDQLENLKLGEAVDNGSFNIQEHRDMNETSRTNGYVNMEKAEKTEEVSQLNTTDQVQNYEFGEVVDGGSSSVQDNCKSIEDQLENLELVEAVDNGSFNIQEHEDNKAYYTSQSNGYTNLKVSEDVRKLSNAEDQVAVEHGSSNIQDHREMDEITSRTDGSTNLKEAEKNVCQLNATEDQVQNNDFGEAVDHESPSVPEHRVMDETNRTNGSVNIEEPEKTEVRQLNAAEDQVQNYELGEAVGHASSSIQDHREMNGVRRTNGSTNLKMTKRDVSQLNATEDRVQNYELGEAAAYPSSNIQDHRDMNGVRRTNGSTNLKKTKDVSQLNATEDRVQNYELGEAAAYPSSNIQDHRDMNGVRRTNGSTNLKNTKDVSQLNATEDRVQNYELGEAAAYPSSNIQDHRDMNGVRRTNGTTNLKKTKDVNQLNATEDRVQNYELDEAAAYPSSNIQDHRDMNGVRRTNGSTNWKKTKDVSQLNAREDRVQNYEYGETAAYPSSNIEGRRDRSRNGGSNNFIETKDARMWNGNKNGEICPIRYNKTFKLEYTDRQDNQTMNNNGEIKYTGATNTSRVVREIRKHSFRDPSTYKDFIPTLKGPSRGDRFSNRSAGPSTSYQGLPNGPDPEEGACALPVSQRSSGTLLEPQRESNHSFLATLDAFMLVLEGTLAGAYRISQNHTGPPIPEIVTNTMQSIRLSLDTLRVHFGYTPQEHFEPMASILRDLLAPAVELFGSICPGLKLPTNPDYYPLLFVPVSEPTVPIVPKQRKKPGYLVTPAEVHGTTVYHRHPVEPPQTPPRIPLFMNLSQDPNLGLLATPDGMLRLNLPFTFQIDITLDGAILLRNLRDKTFAAISSCGTQSAVHTALSRAHQHGKILDIRITDEFAERNMYAKIGIRGIKFGGTDTPSNLYLKDNGNTVAIEYIFKDLENDFIKEVFIDHTSAYGPNYYEACREAIKDCRSKTLTDGSLHFYWRDIKVAQYRNGEITVTRNQRDFIIWCTPEFIHPYTGTEKKGVIRLVTPMTRIISTVMCTPVKQNEKFFMCNLKNNWVYYTTRDYIVSNEMHSAGYSTTPRESTASRAQSQSSGF